MHRARLATVSSSAQPISTLNLLENTALNHTNLGTPNRFVNTSSFGSITETAAPGREIQLSARLSF